MVDKYADTLRIEGMLPLEKAETVLFSEFYEAVVKREFEVARKIVDLMKALEII